MDPRGIHRKVLLPDRNLLTTVEYIGRSYFRTETYGPPRNTSEGHTSGQRLIDSHPPRNTAQNRQNDVGHCRKGVRSNQNPSEHTEPLGALRTPRNTQNPSEHSRNTRNPSEHSRNTQNPSEHSRNTQNPSEHSEPLGTLRTPRNTQDPSE